MVDEYALSCFNVDKNAESFDDATFSDVDDDWGEEKDVRDDESGAGGGDAPSSFPASEMGKKFNFKSFSLSHRRPTLTFPWGNIWTLKLIESDSIGYSV